MTSFTRKFTVLPALSLICALGAAPAALAQTSPPAGTMSAPNTPSAQSESAGATTGLGTSHRFKTMSAATAHCPSDTIVWSSASGKSYHLSSSKYYGKTKHGFYACKAEADGAGFHVSKT